jgi:hypothetical protein
MDTAGLMLDSTCKSGESSTISGQVFSDEDDGYNLVVSRPTTSVVCGFSIC